MGASLNILLRCHSVHRLLSSALVGSAGQEDLVAGLLYFLLPDIGCPLDDAMYMSFLC